MSALCADLESIRATPWVCAASSCSFPENNSNSPEVSRFCPEPVHLDSLIPRMVKLNFLSLRPLVLSYRSRTWFGHSVY
ncbi:hypothetical protein DPMN_176874 [Dreissena polymorpha]|uniref:Uncharacterized protein n=1 Tax=Dreissena polymorpha TaxID=45954 RepID=A0A9D4EC72_DREPO|nr:hypothetical protein DPMN_176874 [Dreissena polymorpha]